MLTNLNCYFNLSFVRPSVRLVIKKLRGGRNQDAKVFCTIILLFFLNRTYVSWFQTLIRHIQMLTHLNCYFNMSFVRPSVCLVINRLRLDSSPPQFLNDIFYAKFDFFAKFSLELQV